MTSAFDFSRFAYKATKPRLTFYKSSDKENRPESTPRPSSPINAHQHHLHSVRSASHCTPTSEAKTVTVVPETPDEERSMSRRHARASKGRERRKRWRIPSSSCSEAENENESRETGSGDSNARVGGLFSSTVVSKRRKRSGEWSSPQRETSLGIREGRRGRETLVPTAQQHVTYLGVAPSEPSSPSLSDMSRDRERGRETYRDTKYRSEGGDDAVDLCTTSVANSDNEKVSTTEVDTNKVNSDSEVSKFRHTHTSQAHLDPSHLPPSPASPSWHCRRKKKKKSSTLSNSGSPRGGDLSRLRELFPQHGEEFLREKLLAAVGVNEAVANILSTEDGEWEPL